MLISLHGRRILRRASGILKCASLGRLIDVNHIGKVTALGTDISQLEDGSLAETLLDVEVVVERRGRTVVRADGKYIHHACACNRLSEGGKNRLIIDDDKAVH